jgi:hypothetical protein
LFIPKTLLKAVLVGYGLSRAHGGFEVFGSVRPKICSVSSSAVREMWKVSGGVASSSSESAEEGGIDGGWKLKVVKSALSRKAEATRGCQCGRVTSQVQADAPSMTLASSTENFSPSSLRMTCALDANAMQRSSVNSWRAELDTAVRTGGSSFMVDVVGMECGGREIWRTEVLLHSHKLQRQARISRS